MTTEDLRIAMENLAPPPMRHSPGDPLPATAEDIAKLGPLDRPYSAEELRILGVTLQSVAAKYHNGCSCGFRYQNNCAHFLANAFLEAGATQLRPPNDCVSAGARCSDVRPIRAREMWCWFRKVATQSSRSLNANTGFWAVFQLNEEQYWGGHVCVVDTATWKYYGTGYYPDWDQYAFKW